MKKLKIFAMAAGFALGGLSMTSCGDSKSKDIAEAAAKQVMILSSDYYISGQMQLIASTVVSDGDNKYTVDITWEGTPAERWDFKNAQVADGKYYITPTLPDLGEPDVPYTLVATAKYKKATAKSREFSGMLRASVAAGSISTAEAKEAAENETVTISGVVSKAFNNESGFFVTDAAGTMYVYSRNTHVGKFEYGDTIAVTGPKISNSKVINGQTVLVPQINATSADASFALVSKAGANTHIPTTGAVETTVEDVLAWSKDPAAADFVNHSGNLLKVTGVCTKYVPSNGNYVTWEIVGSSGKYLSFYCSDSGAEYTEIFGGLEGQTLTFYLGVLDINTSSGGNTTWRTVPLYWEA